MLNALLHTDNYSSLVSILRRTTLHCATYTITHTDNYSNIVLILRRTALHCAAYTGSVECCTVLIGAGASINQPDEDGVTPLHWACTAGHINCVTFLLEAGAYPNSLDSTDQRLTPLDYAILGDHQDLAQHLIEQGALTIASIQELAASMIQKMIRGFLGRRRVARIKAKQSPGVEETDKPVSPQPTESRPDSEQPSELSSTAVKRRLDKELGKSW